MFRDVSVFNSDNSWFRDVSKKYQADLRKLKPKDVSEINSRWAIA